MAKDLRGFFSPGKADDAGGLTPVKEENAVRWKKARKDWSVFKFVDYQVACGDVWPRFIQQGVLAGWGGLLGPLLAHPVAEALHNIKPRPLPHPARAVPGFAGAASLLACRI